MAEWRCGAAETVASTSEHVFQRQLSRFDKIVPLRPTSPIPREQVERQAAQDRQADDELQRSRGGLREPDVHIAQDIAGQQRGADREGYPAQGLALGQEADQPRHQEQVRYDQVDGGVFQYFPH